MEEGAHTNNVYRACTHDPSVDDNPEEFLPERYIRDGRIDFTNVLDPSWFAFGFGRRCVLFLVYL